MVLLPKRPQTQAPTLPSYGKETNLVRAPGTKLPRGPGLPPSSGAVPSHYSQAGLQAKQGARRPCGEQQHQSQGQGHRAPRRPRLRKDGHRARGPAPGPCSGSPLTEGPGGPSEPPPPRAPWPGDAQGAAAGARAGPAEPLGAAGAEGPASRPAGVRVARHCAPSPAARGRPVFATPPARTPAQAPPISLTPPPAPPRPPLPAPPPAPRVLDPSLGARVPLRLQIHLTPATE